MGTHRPPCPRTYPPGTLYWARSAAGSAPRLHREGRRFESGRAHVRLADVVNVLEQWFPPELAEPWDSVGLSFGDQEAEVHSVLLAVDPTTAVAEQAQSLGVDLLITHHPLWLSGVTGLRGAKGRLAQDMIRAGIALFNAHTNADRAQPGVNDALAARLGLSEVVALETASQDLLKVSVYVPAAHRERLIDALSHAGAGAIGDYDRCAYSTPGSGTFRPMSGAVPHIGEVGRIEQVAEDRVEMVLPLGRRDAVATALLGAHPYEEPAYDFAAVTRVVPDTGLGRVGEVPTQSLAEFAGVVASALPATAAGVRFAGAPGTQVRRVAVVGGSGASELAAASRVADVIVTADLKHHTVDEHLAEGGCAVVDVAHWASEWPWCPQTAERLSGLGLQAHVSELVTDPWTGHVGGSNES
jgi:dinuclear metal center YbgI/SA1388 family protein